MGLKDRIYQDMQKAAKERNSLALSALRMAMAAIRNREIEVRSKEGLSVEAVGKVVATLVKQRREAVALFRQGNRPELAEREEGEIEVLSRYLPAEMSGEELELLAREVIGALDAKGPADVGRVMKELMPRVSGRADGKVVNELVRRLLSG